MHSTLRNSTIVLAAALVLGATGSGAAMAASSASVSVSVLAKPAAAATDQSSASGTTAPLPGDGTSTGTVPLDPGAPYATEPSPPSTAPVDSAAAAADQSARNASDGARAGDVADAGGTPCAAAAVACVSLSQQQAWLMRGGKVVYGPVPVATGRDSMPTPTGVFHVKYKVRDSWSVPYQSWMPWAVYFYGGDAFHEDSVNVRSHGCIHLTAASAQYFYNFLKTGDEVQVVR